MLKSALWVLDPWASHSQASLYSQNINFVFTSSLKSCTGRWSWWYLDTLMQSAHKYGASTGFLGPNNQYGRVSRQQMAFYWQASKMVKTKKFRVPQLASKDSDNVGAKRTSIFSKAPAKKVSMGIDNKEPCRPQPLGLRFSSVSSKLCLHIGTPKNIRARVGRRHDMRTSGWSCFFWQCTVVG